MRRKRWQRGSLQRRRHGRHLAWVALWREDDGKDRIRRSKVLGRCSQMTEGEAMQEFNEVLLKINTRAGQLQIQVSNFGEFVRKIYLPHQRGRWKDSTWMTSENRITVHLVSEFGDIPMREITLERLQQFLEAKAASGLSFSVVSHLRWELRAIFEMARSKGLVEHNPATCIYTPKTATREVNHRVMSTSQIFDAVQVLPLRERLAFGLATFGGMRPGEILGLKWKHVRSDCVEVRQRIYRGKIDTPKTHKSNRLVALPPTVIRDLEEWKRVSFLGDDSWVFPSEKLATPLARDNFWRRHLQRMLEAIGLGWASFQVMRRTHASLARKIGIDPKVVADQLGHGLGVSLDVYTKSDLEQKAEAARILESKIFEKTLIGVNGVTDEGTRSATA